MINKYNVISYITPDNFINNYDEQIINVFQQKDAFEFLTTYVIILIIYLKNKKYYII